jgi:hypothetical protein
MLVIGVGSKPELAYKFTSPNSDLSTKRFCLDSRDIDDRDVLQVGAMSYKYTASKPDNYFLFDQLRKSLINGCPSAINEYIPGGKYFA